MIGLQLAGKNNRISATVFAKSLNVFLDLLKDVDSAVSRQARGTVRWELVSLQKNSPAMVGIAGESRIKEMDYSQAIQESVLDGLEQLAHKAEQPQFYSYSALKHAKSIAEISKVMKLVSVFTNDRRTIVNDRILINVEYLIASGSKSLGSVRGSLDAISVHSGHEFRVWSPKWRRPIVCRFDRSMLPEVKAHLKQQVEVFGELTRNTRGEPVAMNVEQFVALEPLPTQPSVQDMRGILPGLYTGSLGHYMDELRNEGYTL